MLSVSLTLGVPNTKEGNQCRGSSDGKCVDSFIDHYLLNVTAPAKDPYLFSDTSIMTVLHDPARPASHS